MINKMLNLKKRCTYFFVLPIIACNFFSIANSNELNQNSPELAAFPEKTLKYKFNCGLKKTDCKITISKNYLRINGTKIRKTQIKKINNKLLCKNEFGISKCLPGSIKNIEYQKITLIYKQKDSLKAKLLFIKNMKIASEFNKNLTRWVEWDSINA